MCTLEFQLKYSCNPLTRINLCVPLPFFSIVPHQPVSLETQLVSDLGPPDLLLLSEENNDPASLESSNASSTLPLLPSLDTAPTGNSSAPSDSQNAHLGVQGTNLLTGKEATGAVGVGTDYPPSSLQTEVSQNDASSLAMMSTDRGGGGSVAQGAGDPSHTVDTTPHLSSNVPTTGGISEQTVCLDPQQVHILSTCKLLSLSTATSGLL